MPATRTRGAARFGGVHKRECSRARASLEPSRRQTRAREDEARMQLRDARRGRMRCDRAQRRAVSCAPRRSAAPALRAPAEEVDRELRTILENQTPRTQWRSRLKGCANSTKESRAWQKLVGIVAKRARKRISRDAVIRGRRNSTMEKSKRPPHPSVNVTRHREKRPSKDANVNDALQASTQQAVHCAAAARGCVCVLSAASLKETARGASRGGP